MIQTDKSGCLGTSNDQILFQPMVGYTKANYTDYAEGVGTLKANGGDLGGGSETLIVYAIDGYNGTIGDTQSSLGVNCGISTGRNGVLLITEECSPKPITPELTNKPHTRTL